VTEISHISHKNVVAEPVRFITWRLLIVLAAAGFLAWACYHHRFRLNDEHYMLWTWRHVPAWPLYPGIFIAAVPFFLGQWLARRSAIIPAIGLLMLSTFALGIAFNILQDPPPDVNVLGFTVVNRTNGGYYDGGALFESLHWPIRQVLSQYPNLMTRLMGHLYNKPPGPALFCWGIIHIFGDNISTANLLFILIAAGAALAVPATYLLTRQLTSDRVAAFAAASYLSLCPGVLLFLPCFDVCYILCTVALAVLWLRAIQTDRMAYSVVFGLVYAIAFFFTYLPAVLVLLLIGIAILRLSPNRGKSFVKHAGLALIVFAAFYLALWLLTGFNPIATFRSALANEHGRMATWTQSNGFPPRKLPGTIPWDLYSFALGSGWISFLLVAMYFLRFRHVNSEHGTRKLAMLCIAQILFVAVAGLIPSETARVWLFMLPLLVLPIGLELSRWNFWARQCVYAALLVLTTLILQSMRLMIITRYF
jgi:4-amino-4-deoxy-L-arabinose transferase-like glycosyltransferase